jgi:hypothetical protein
VVDVLTELSVWSDAINNIYFVPLLLDPSAGKAFADLMQWGAARRILALGLKRDGRVNVNPPGNEPLRDGDLAIVVSAKRPERIDLAG